MKIEIWSDVMCPFCYIGKKSFELALDKIPYKDKIDVEWKSFQLNSNLSKTEIISIEDYLIRRKGFSKEQVEQMNQQIYDMGERVGIHFNFDEVKVVDTSDAHKLIHFAQENGKGSEIEEELFKAYFIEGKNVADFEVLSDLSDKIGLDKEKTLEILNSDSYVFDIASDILEARNIGVTGVPFFVIDRKYTISGAQSIEYFESALIQAYEKHYLNDSSQLNASCDIDSDC